MQKEYVKIPASRVVLFSLLALVLGLISPFFLGFSMNVLLMPVFTVMLYAAGGMAPVIVGNIAQLFMLSVTGGNIGLVMGLLALVLPVCVILRGVTFKKTFAEQLSAGITVQLLGMVAAFAAAYFMLGRANLVDSLLNVFRVEFEQMLPGITDMMLGQLLGLNLTYPATDAAFLTQGVLTAVQRAEYMDTLMETLRTTFTLSMPAAMFQSGVLTALLCVYLPNRSFRKRNMTGDEAFLPFSKWYLPAGMTGGLILIFVISFVMMYVSSFTGMASVYLAVRALVFLAFTVQAIAALDRKMILVNMGSRPRIATAGILLIMSTMFAELSMMIAAIGTVSALAGSHGAVRMWKNNRDKNNRKGEE